jgi:staphyloferrin B biosynthesis citrate synthase
VPDATPVLINPVKRRLQRDELALGLIVRLARSGDIAHIAKASGFDFLFIDTQHAIYSLETIAHVADASRGCDVAALVRTRSVRDPDVSLLLDGGVAGIVFPDVNSADDARTAVNACRFAPLGKRSATTGYKLLDFRPIPSREALDLMNAYTLVVCMIESVAAVENVEEIAAVPGVDVLLIGMTDLLADMGKPGAYGDPQAMRAVERVAAACKAHGKHLGSGGDNDPQRQALFVRQGVRFIPTSSDGAFILAAAGSTCARLRALPAR